MPEKQPIPPNNPLEQQLRQAVNDATVQVVSKGFEALDILAEAAKDHLKRAVLRGMLGPGKQIK